jgi:nucleotide-binding universal stress UspA family protein
LYGERGFNALRIASRIAKGTDSELTALHVIEEVPDRYASRFEHTIAEPGKTVADLYKDVEKVKETISGKVDEILEEIGVSGKKKFVTSKNIADVILEETDGYDLVVLGSGGFKGMERMLFGSVSYKVAEYAKVPVLIVKRMTDEIKKILTCTDGSETAKMGCLMGATLGKALDAEVTILSVAPVFADEEFAKECDLECVNMVRRKVGIEARSLCRSGKGVKGVREEIIKEAPNYDLVVIGSRGLSKIERMRLGHVSLGVKENAESNVLIVRGFKL